MRKARSKPLSAAFCKTIKEPGRYGDGGYGGHGLYLRVHRMKSGRLSKSWGQRIRIGGRPTNLGLGPFPVVTLAEARETALDNRRVAFQGEDPRRQDQPTFAQAAEKLIRLKAKGWKKGSRQPDQWRQSLRDYVNPKIGHKLVGEVTTADVLAVLKPIWNTKSGTARLVRTRLGLVMAWAIAEGYRTDNPCGRHISAALPLSHEVTHYKAAPPAEVAGILKRVSEANSQPAVTLPIQFIALTAVRVSEALGATWEEIDLNAKVWHIPASRMKGGKRDHIVPLSSRAVALLGEARSLKGKQAGGFVFPTAKTGKPAHFTTLSVLVRKLKVATTIHGFRSSFRNWCAEEEVDRQVAEACLAHTVKGVEAAYLRTTMVERRRTVMEEWGRFITP